jgi:hypothetical protein
MSKRYGRNQKRAHRAIVAGMEAEAATLRAQNARLFEANRDLANEIACAKRIVGEYCVAFNPRSSTLSLHQSDFIEVMEYEKQHNVGVYKYWDFNPNEMLAPISMHRIRLPIMCVIADREHIRGSRHLKVVYDSKAWGYAIDPMAWRMSRYPEVLCRNIAERLTYQIYEEMSKDTTVRAELRRTHTRNEPDPRISEPRFQFPGGYPDFPR